MQGTRILSSYGLNKFRVHYCFEYRTLLRDLALMEEELSSFIEKRAIIDYILAMNEKNILMTINELCQITIHGCNESLRILNAVLADYRKDFRFSIGKKAPSKNVKRTSKKKVIIIQRNGMNLQKVRNDLVFECEAFFEARSCKDDSWTLDAQMRRTVEQNSPF
jgi:hypothetical protein